MCPATVGTEAKWRTAGNWDGAQCCTSATVNEAMMTRTMMRTMMPTSDREIIIRIRINRGGGGSK